MIINDRKAKQYIINQVSNSIIGHLCDISNYSQGKYPFEFSSYSAFNNEEKVNKGIDRVIFYLDNFSMYMDMNNFIEDYFRKNHDNHWKHSKERFKLYLNHIQSIRIEEKVEDLIT